MTATTAPEAGRHRLDRDGGALEVEARRDGVRTVVALLRDGHRIAERSGVGGVLLPVPEEPEAPAPDDTAQPEPEAAPRVVVFSHLPGKINRALLVIPAPEAEAGKGTDQSTSDEGADGAEGSTPETGSGGSTSGADGKPPRLGALVAALTGHKHGEQHRFAPPPGTLAAQLQTFQHTHPKLYASRHVVLAVGKVVFGLLGVALFVQLILKRIIGWIVERLPDIDLPSIPWPDIDLPDITLPGWLLAIIGSAKYWVPILIAIGLAVREARRRTGRKSDEREQAPNTGDPERTGDPDNPESAEDDRGDANR